MRRVVRGCGRDGIIEGFSRWNLAFWLGTGLGTQQLGTQ